MSVVHCQTSAVESFMKKNQNGGIINFTMNDCKVQLINAKLVHFIGKHITDVVTKEVNLTILMKASLVSFF